MAYCLESSYISINGLLWHIMIRGTRKLYVCRLWKMVFHMEPYDGVFLDSP